MTRARYITITIGWNRYSAPRLRYFLGLSVPLRPGRLTFQIGLPGYCPRQGVPAGSLRSSRVTLSHRPHSPAVFWIGPGPTLQLL